MREFRKFVRTTFTFQVINAPDLEKGQSLKIKFENATQPIKGEILKISIKESLNK